MGGNNSKPVFKDIPWRPTKEWSERGRDELKAEVIALRPEPNPRIPSLNILLAGQIGSGKSSFINSLYRVMRGGVSLGAAAGAGNLARSLTKELTIYTMSQDVRIWDIFGIQGDNDLEVDIINIMHAVEGHVPNGYQFQPGHEFGPESPGYIADPNPADTPHCVAIVVNAQNVSLMDPDSIIVKKLKNLAKQLFDKHIPFVVLLTHMDEFFPLEVHHDITKIFHYIPLETLVKKIKNIVHGLPENQIFPVINYTKRVELDPNMDILLLYAFREMLGASKSYIEIKYQTQPPVFENPQALKFGQQEEGERSG